MRASPESAHARNQESTSHRSAAVPGGLSHRRNTRKRKGVPARGLPFCARGNCARHRRALTLAIKRAHCIALLPYRVD
ncbi:bS18 family ribosomal protein [Stomatobaculum longum]|uniref:bS18 family ribosomal protein n=1 Tax=Stomatobaculum longum TaxID=796942 RepID=UPI0028E7EF47|nr:bS18 family ribosomal protein [Stomatobaculum longum]